MSDISRAETLMQEKDSESVALAALEAKIKEVEKLRAEDHFFFIFVLVLIFDTILFINIVDGLAAFALVVMELIFLMMIASRFGVKNVEIIFTRLAYIWSRNR